MSRIYFHSEHGEARVSGTERHHMGGVMGSLFNVMLGLDNEHDYDGSRSMYRGLLSPNNYLISAKDFVGSLRTALWVGHYDTFQIDSSPVNIFSAQLNTALRVGNDVIKLMARLHGQCEIHCWVAGENRAWLASIIERGVEIGLLRDSPEWPTGWGAVVSLLRSRSDDPVVTSYSVCDQFPSRHAARWAPPDDEGPEDDEDEDDYNDWASEAWSDLPKSEQWRLGMEALKQDPQLELSPQDWDSYYFRGGIDAFAIKKAAEAAARINKAPSGSAP